MNGIELNPGISHTKFAIRCPEECDDAPIEAARNKRSPPRKVLSNVNPLANSGNEASDSASADMGGLFGQFDMSCPLEDEADPRHTDIDNSAQTRKASGRKRQDPEAATR